MDQLDKLILNLGDDSSVSRNIIDSGIRSPAKEYSTGNQPSPKTKSIGRPFEDNRKEPLQGSLAASQISVPPRGTQLRQEQQQQEVGMTLSQIAEASGYRQSQQVGSKKAHTNLENLLQSFPDGGIRASQYADELNSIRFCEYCNVPVEPGQAFVQALGHLFHTDHFKCNQCGLLIDNNTYFERNNGIICHKCFDQSRDPVAEDSLSCAYCNQLIKGSCISALGKSWHAEHFFCSQCGVPFEPDQPFLDHDGKAYCDEDYYNMFAPKCGKCDKPIRDNIINGLGKTFHEECFGCEEPGCNVIFAETGNFLEHNGKAFCDMHFNSVRGNFCGECNRPITGRCVTALGRRYHVDHFQCSSCHKQLATGGGTNSSVITTTFKARDGRPFCTSCHVRLFG